MNDPEVYEALLEELAEKDAAAEAVWTSGERAAGRECARERLRALRG